MRDEEVERMMSGSGKRAEMMLAYEGMRAGVVRRDSGSEFVLIALLWEMRFSKRRVRSEHYIINDSQY